MLNKAILMGRLTRDPELRHTQSNMAVCSFSLAIDRGRKDQNGERQTDFITASHGAVRQSSLHSGSRRVLWQS